MLMVVRMSAINGCLEREGLARLTISILIITTAGCLAYTWGYAEGVHNSRTVIVPNHTAAPVILHAAEVKLAGPVMTTSKSDSDNSAAAAHPTKRIHTRRRARKNPPDTAPVPSEPHPVQRGSAQHGAVGPRAGIAASIVETTSTGHARALRQGALDNSGHAVLGLW